MLHLVLTLVSDALLNQSAELLDHQVGLECSNPKVFQSFLLPDLLELADFHRLLRVILDCQKDQSQLREPDYLFSCALPRKLLRCLVPQ